MRNKKKLNQLKGNEVFDRMRELMQVNEVADVSRSEIKITKKGPDGKVYAIVRENHNYYIMSTDKTKDIVAEDFTYKGGLANITEDRFKTYSKALKQLNNKLVSINADSHHLNENYNVIRNDNLLSEKSEITNKKESGLISESKLVSESKEEPILMTLNEQKIDELINRLSGNVNKLKMGKAISDKQKGLNSSKKKKN